MGEVGIRFLVSRGWTGCTGSWVVLGVGAGICFGFGGVTRGGGMTGLEEPGSLPVVGFWSFAKRFSRICKGL